MLEKMIAKQLAPMLAPKAEELEQTLLRYLQGIPLQQGETHATAVADVDTDGSGRQSLVFVVAAFKQGIFVRLPSS
jgi:hypothetical protein